MQTISVNGAVKETGRAPSAAMRIRVNGVEIAETQILGEAQNHPADDPQSALHQAGEALAIRELLLQEAARLGLTAMPEPCEDGSVETEEDALVRQLLDREVSVPDADEEVCRRYFDNNRDKFRTPALYEADHILIAAAPDDAKAREEAHAHACAIVARVKDKPSSFANIARDVSACPSAQQGGSLGQISRGQTVPEFERALGGLRDGETASQPVETRYGFHVVRLHRSIPGRPLEYETVVPTIARYIEEASWRRAIAQYISILAEKAVIEGISIGSAHGPLVQ